MEWSYWISGQPVPRRQAQIQRDCAWRLPKHATSLHRLIQWETQGQSCGQNLSHCNFWKIFFKLACVFSTTSMYLMVCPDVVWSRAAVKMIQGTTDLSVKIIIPKCSKLEIYQHTVKWAFRERPLFTSHEIDILFKADVADLKVPNNNTTDFDKSFLANNR